MLTDLLIRALWAVLIAGLLLSLYWVVNKVILARVVDSRSVAVDP